MVQPSGADPGFAKGGSVSRPARCARVCMGRGRAPSGVRVFPHEAGRFCLFSHKCGATGNRLSDSSPRVRSRLLLAAMTSPTFGQWGRPDPHAGFSPSGPWVRRRQRAFIFSFIFVNLGFTAGSGLILHKSDTQIETSKYFLTSTRL